MKSNVLAYLVNSLTRHLRSVTVEYNNRSSEPCSATALVVPVALARYGSEDRPMPHYKLWLYDSLVEPEGDSFAVVTDIRVLCKPQLHGPGGKQRQSGITVAAIQLEWVGVASGRISSGIA